MLRSLSREKAMRSEVLIAYRMNGRELPHEHGFPVRAIVPGHYGMASVKWLTGIHAVREPFQGYRQTSDYGYWDAVNGQPVRRPLGEIRLKSQIARPRVYESLPPNEIYTVTGTAWAGETEVTEISVSTDGGQSWREAGFIDPPTRYAWRRWKLDWLTPKTPGKYVLLARAKDAGGGCAAGGSRSALRDLRNSSSAADRGLRGRRVSTFGIEHAVAGPPHPQPLSREGRGEQEFGRDRCL